ncbi:hypothetical protein HYZ97_02830 [Candidatus Pacearchaeota archaeon]|nr:hypothetical protein [Candidatus Pacearchaeota archaeon]
MHELLPKLSWNSVLRTYHQTSKFIPAFTHAGEPERGHLLKEIGTAVLFTHQANNDVNLWLYKHHKDFCESQGISFLVQ